MKILVTAGPSYAPIDEVRRITNFSTGELGVVLAEHLAEAGHEVICAKGTGAVHRSASSPVVTQQFNTNEDLEGLLDELGRQHSFQAVFHTAALSDFRVKEIHAPGEVTSSAKLPSTLKEIHLTLVPARKLLSRFRERFPNAKIVGWKYELDGTREDAVRRARQQIQSCRTDGCVVNGRAYGDGFGFLRSDGTLEFFADKRALAHGLAGWVGE